MSDHKNETVCSHGPSCNSLFCKLIAQGWVLIDPSGTAWASDTRPYASSGPSFDPPLADPIQFAIERNDCECDVCLRARAAAEAQLESMRQEYVKLHAHAEGLEAEVQRLRDEYFEHVGTETL